MPLGDDPPTTEEFFARLDGETDTLTAAAAADETDGDKTRFRRLKAWRRPPHDAPRRCRPTPQFLPDVKAAVIAARARAVLALSAAVIAAYWEIGRGILARQEREGWAAKVVRASRRRPQARVPGERCAKPKSRATCADGRARRCRASSAPCRRPTPSLCATPSRNPYNFDFLNLLADAKERDLEFALLNDVQKFLMEMSRGFALVGRQFPLRVPRRGGRRGGCCKIGDSNLRRTP